jgi:hypothetical protein
MPLVHRDTARADCPGLLALHMLDRSHNCRRGPPISRMRDALPIQGLPTVGQVSYSPCGHTYQERDGRTSSAQPCKCGLFSIGVCARCGTFACGAHGRLAGEHFLCVEHARAEEQATRPAAILAAGKELQPAQLARKAEMSALVEMLQAAARAPSSARLLTLRKSFPRRSRENAGGRPISRVSASARSRMMHSARAVSGAHPPTCRRGMMQDL